jgi:single-strand selective monofunctional uracil DNA glycosylase
LAFLEAGGANRTPDKLPPSEKVKLFAACDEHLREVVRILQPEWLLGIGAFAEGCAWRVFPGNGPRIASVLHPSPASPAANRDWSGLATAKLEELGVWKRLLNTPSYE